MRKVFIHIVYVLMLISISVKYVRTPFLTQPCFAQYAYSQSIASIKRVAQQHYAGRRDHMHKHCPEAKKQKMAEKVSAEGYYASAEYKFLALINRKVCSACTNFVGKPLIQR